MESEQHKDNRLKYLDLNKAFNNRVSQIKLDLKVSNKTCEMLAIHVSKQKPKDAIEFERVEKLKEYVLATSKLNDDVLSLLEYVNGLLIDIGSDSNVLIEGAILRDRLQFQSDTYEATIRQREDAIKMIYDLRKDQINP